MSDRAAHIAVRHKRGRRKQSAFKMKAANKQCSVACIPPHVHTNQLMLVSRACLKTTFALKSCLCHSHSEQPLIFGCSSTLSCEIVPLVLLISSLRNFPAISATPQSMSQNTSGNEPKTLLPPHRNACVGIKYTPPCQPMESIQWSGRAGPRSPIYHAYPHHTHDLLLPSWCKKHQPTLRACGSSARICAQRGLEAATFWYSSLPAFWPEREACPKPKVSPSFSLYQSKCRRRVSWIQQQHAVAACGLVSDCSQLLLLCTCSSCCQNYCIMKECRCLWNLQNGWAVSPQVQHMRSSCP